MQEFELTQEKYDELRHVQDDKLTCKQTLLLLPPITQLP